MGTTGNYCLANDIDASSTSVTPFTPIGSNLQQFIGVFDGNGHVIQGLTINSSATDVGLFGYTNTVGTIRNIGLSNLSVTATTAESVGGLVGTNSGTVTDSYTTGALVSKVGAFVSIGGLARSNQGTILRSNSSASVSQAIDPTNFVYLGGLVGVNDKLISDSYATGVVTGRSLNTITGFTHEIGGLVGHLERGTVAQSYSTGNLSIENATSYTGGLVGEMFSGTITQSYATGASTSVGAFSALSAVGGLVGLMNSGTVTQSYATVQQLETPAWAG
jgi:hypothetical protein